MSTLEAISRLVTALIFFGAGYLLSRKFHPTHRWVVWAVLVFALFLADYIGVNSALVSVFGIAVYVDVLLEGLGFGFVAGFLMQGKA